MIGIEGTFDCAVSKNIKLEQLVNIFGSLGSKKLYIKKLAANDNSKNQPYFGSHLTDLFFIPAGELVGSNTTSKKKVDPRRNIKYQASVNLSWVDAKASTKRSLKFHLLVSDRQRFTIDEEVGSLGDIIEFSSVVRIATRQERHVSRDATSLQNIH